MAASSAARAIRPSNASTSRTRWPLPSPPIAGLQDMVPICSRLKLTSPTRAPTRAAAAAASHPACPPPTTNMSNASVTAPIYCSTWNMSLADAETAEQRIEHVLDAGAAGDPVQRRPRRSQILRRQDEIVLRARLHQRSQGFGKRVSLPPVQGHIAFLGKKPSSPLDD